MNLFRAFACIILLPLFLYAKPPITLSDIETLRTYTPFSLTQKTLLTPPLQRHFETYDTQKEHFHSYGHIITKQDTLALFYFTPPRAHDIVVLIHGYFDNSGNLSALRNHLLKEGYAVISLDLPGHGLSSGKRGSITSFRRYADAVSTVISIAQETNLPVHTIGHSTGCAPLLDLIMRKEKSWDGQTILVAPLVRSALWGVSKLGAGILSPFTSETKRLYRNSSHDERFKKLLKEDPLGVKTFPVEWSNALYVWNKVIEKRNPVTGKITVIQGTDDGTVDWRYNMKFLQKKVSHTEIDTIKNGRHHLLNETPFYKDKVFHLITTSLSETEENQQVVKNRNSLNQKEN